ncbi:MAG: hypothetical protein SFW09_11730 [Hyphomicrobiaceae bacterium]|nr:hypothetical protein [Hyphomicrobiaceae bacterium]
MSTTTFAASGDQQGLASKGRLLLQRLTEILARRAEARLRSFAAGRSDAQLADLGLSRDDIASLRRHGRLSRRGT